MKTLNESAPKPRHHNIDLLECLAMALVVLYHCQLMSCDFVHNPSFVNFFNFYAIAICSCGVPLFFFCNGYLLLNRPLDLKRHLLKTLKTMAVTVVWGLLTILVMMPIDKVFLQPVDFLKAFLNKTDTFIGYFWFMGAFVCIQLLFPLFKGAFDSNKAYALYMALLCYAAPLANTAIDKAASFAVKDFGGVFFGMFNPLKGATAYSFEFFFLGGLAGFYKDEILGFFDGRKLKRVPLALGVCALSCAALATYGVFKSLRSGRVWDMVFNSYDSIFTLVAVCGIFLACMDYAPTEGSAPGKCVRLVSVNTLGVYFLHEIFIHATRPRLVELPFCTNVPCNIVYAAALLAVCTAVAALAKKVPVLRWLF